MIQRMIQQMKSSQNITPHLKYYGTIYAIKLASLTLELYKV
jgi:hypothetical protein